MIGNLKFQICNAKSELDPQFEDEMRQEGRSDSDRASGQPLDAVDHLPLRELFICAEDHVAAVVRLAIDDDMMAEIADIAARSVARVVDELGGEGTI